MKTIAPPSLLIIFAVVGCATAEDLVSQSLERLVYVFAYWNNEKPPSNDVFIDDLVIATSRSPPPNQDAAGNRRIGDWMLKQ